MQSVLYLDNRWTIGQSHVLSSYGQEDGLPPHSEQPEDKIASSMKGADLGLEFQLRRKSPDFPGRVAFQTSVTGVNPVKWYWC